MDRSREEGLVDLAYDRVTTLMMIDPQKVWDYQLDVRLDILLALRPGHPRRATLAVRLFLTAEKYLTEAREDNGNIPLPTGHRSGLGVPHPLKRLVTAFKVRALRMPDRIEAP